jgi:hypothetical protein
MESGRYCVAVAIAPKLAVGYLTLRFTADVFPTVLFDLILEVLPFIERPRTRPPTCGRIRLCRLPAADKSVALGRIEPLHGAAYHFDLPSDDPG